MDLSIGQLSEKTKLSIHTLRYYEKEGLVPFVKRTTSGIRIYEEAHVGWFKFLCCLRETGMSIPQLKEYTNLTVQGDGTIDQRLHMLTEQQKEIAEQIKTFQSYINMIGFKMDMLTQQKQHGTPIKNG